MVVTTDGEADKDASAGDRDNATKTTWNVVTYCYLQGDGKVHLPRMPGLGRPLHGEMILYSCGVGKGLELGKRERIKTKEKER